MAEVKKVLDRPYVVMVMGASVDGRIALGPGLTMFDSHPGGDVLPNPAEGEGEAIVADIKAALHPQGEIMGSATLMRESDPLRELPAYDGDPQPLYEDFLPEEVLQATTNWAILVDGRGRRRTGSKCTEYGPGKHILHLTSHAAAPEYLAFLRRERIPYLVGGEEHVDLPNALRKLRAKLGLECVTLIGGGTLNGAMLRAGLIDEVFVHFFPAFFGGRATPTLADCADLGPDEIPTLLELVSATPLQNGIVWLHYRVRNT